MHTFAELYKHSIPLQENIRILILMRTKKVSSFKSKSKNMFHIASCVLALEVSKGHLAWTVSGLVKKSGLSRTLIYRYLGGNKKVILDNSIDLFVDTFYGFTRLEHQQPLWNLIKIARKHILLFPEAAIFYQKCRSLESPLKNKFILIEQKFQKKLKKIFPHKSETEILVLHTIIHGLVTAPFLTVSDVDSILKYLKISRLQLFGGLE